MSMSTQNSKDHKKAKITRWRIEIMLEAPVAQQTIPQNSTFQTDDLDIYDSDYDDLSLAKAVLMANLSRCDPEVLSEVV
ncbi:hypothetical protein Tco_0134490 [Tanacetum coccineum]